MGQGSLCCRYIVADGSGVHCGKLEPELKRQIDRRVQAGMFTAVADNCDGKPHEDKLR